MSRKGKGKTTISRFQKQTKASRGKQMDIFNAGIEAIIRKYRKWGTEAEIKEMIDKKTKSLFYSTFGPKIKDKYRPKIDYDFATRNLHFSFVVKEGKEKDS